MEDFTERQSKSLAIVTRVAASISCVCAMYMAVKAYQSRDRMYHRLMLGLSLHLIVYSAWFMYGPAAVPANESEGEWGARGTIQTCAAQGFFVQVGYAIPFYYASLSFYSFQAVRYNFDVSKYQHMEKWIHMGVHIFPIGSAIYLLLIEALNPTGHYQCWIASVPLGCGDETGVECVRGPQDIAQVAWLLAGLPAFLYCLFPTVAMVALYRLTRRRQRYVATSHHNHVRRSSATAHTTAILACGSSSSSHNNNTSQQSNSSPYPWTPARVAKQAALYLLGLFWTYIFSMISHGLQWIGGIKIFALSLLAVLNANLMGVWMLLIYRYFRVVIPRSKMAAAGFNSSSSSSSGGNHNSRVSEAGEEQQQEVGTTSNNSNGNSNKTRKEEPASSFSIFDGTNATGAFAQYIFDADSEDEAEDHQESDLWNEVQPHV